ncbi:inactive protein RESTRICTED TEV MOVEMENT 2-like [Herrania umbratica]|uniref:Inactive protein RESTRICTED TEV MOVEMENT 2-like n=1 Tax=Herrania umbratica TaxID=108875 RepID=A0A6J0ZVH2_9ROSI|nr:inactive protein RESTRICTED TEV MOVEMENT 2-like [Herrania umbratica]
MDSKPGDIDVHTEWVHEAVHDTLIAYLPGFRKEQLKVQVTSTGNLRISGQRPIGDNKFNRFNKEIPIPSNCDQDNVRANFANGMLHVKLPKLIVPAEKQEEAKPAAEVLKSDQKPAPQPQSPAHVPQKQKNGSEQAVDQQAPPKAPMEKQSGDQKKDGVAKEADNVSQKAPDKEKGMKDEKYTAKEDAQKAMEKEEKGSDQEEKATSSEKLETLGDSVQDAAGKENIEPKKCDGVDIYQLGINYKQVLDGLVKGLKSPRKMMNMVLAVLLVVVLAVYLINAIRSLGNY